MSPDFLDLDVEDLPPKQRQVLEAIAHFVQTQGYPPSIQQLCDRCGVSSTSTIHYHVTALKKKGFIDWNPSEKRSMTLAGGVREEIADARGHLPMLGSIAAGRPLQTVSDATETLDLAGDLCPSGCYALRVRGDSMVEDHIMDGDMVIINPKSRARDGDVVVALVDGETATLKRIYREKGGMVRLQPANAAMAPILVPESGVDVQGKVEAVIRKVT